MSVSYLPEYGEMDNGCWQVAGSLSEPSSLDIHISMCYSRQGARCEQRKGGRGQTAGNHSSCKQRGSSGRQRKAGTSRLTGNHTLWDDKCPGDTQRKVGKGENLQRPIVTCYPLCSHYSDINLADKKFPSCTDAMTPLIKSK